MIKKRGVMLLKSVDEKSKRVALLEELQQSQLLDASQKKWLREELMRFTKGHTTYRSPEGADGGADILAGAGPLGFGAPRLCVEVKSESSPIDRPTVDKLLGAVSKFGADDGLFVSWSGFKSNVQKELAASGAFSSSMTSAKQAMASAVYCRAINWTV